MPTRTDAGDVVAALRGDIWCQWCEDYGTCTVSANRKYAVKLCDKCFDALLFNNDAESLRGPTGHRL